MSEPRRDPFDEGVAYDTQDARPDLDVGLIEASLDGDDGRGGVARRDAVRKQAKAFVGDPRLELVSEAIPSQSAQ